MYETSLSRMTMQLPPGQMANQDGDAGMETMLWDFNIIPNELDYGYLMLPPGVLHMSALGRFGRFTLFSPRVSHSNTCRFLFFACFVFCLFVALLCFWFLFCKCLGIPNSPRSLDLDDPQGLIARSAVQQKKKQVFSRPCFAFKIVFEALVIVAQPSALRNVRRWQLATRMQWNRSTRTAQCTMVKDIVAKEV